MLLQQPDPFKVHGLESPFLDFVKATLLRADPAQQARAEAAFISPPTGRWESQVSAAGPEREVMTQEQLWQVLDASWGDPRALSALLCSSAAAVVLLKWLGQRQVQQKMDEARRSRDLALERMEKAARRLKQEVSLGYMRGRDYILDNQRNGGALISPSVNGGWGMGTFWSITNPMFCEGHHPPSSQKALP